jgi:YD repeat-containing protein
MKYIQFTLLTLCVIFASCQKEVDPSMNETEDPKKLVSRVIETDPGVPGEAWMLEFKYDAQQRCTTLVEKTIDSTSGTPVVTEEANYTFHYNGTESRPNKITYDAFGTVVTWFPKFDAQGKKIQDSVLDAGSGYKEIVNYTYNNNKIIAEYKVEVFGQSLSFLDTVYHDGNNMTKQISAEHSQGSLLGWYEMMYTYDNHPNPLGQTNISTSFFASSSYLAIGTFIGLNKNNVLSESYRDLLSSTGPEVTQYQYTYDGDGYPALFRYTDGSYTGTIRYEYK